MSLFRKPTEPRNLVVPFDIGPPLQGPGLTQDRALTLAPVYAAHRHLADNVATLPLKAFQAGKGQRKPISLPPLFQSLADRGELVDWITSAVLSMAAQGNAIGIIHHATNGFPDEVEWRPRTEFTVDDRNGTVNARWYWNGNPIDRLNIVHIPWLKIPGRTLGLSPLEAAQMTIESGLKAQKYGNDWFNSGGVPPGTFKNTQQKVPQEEANKIKTRLTRAIKSGEPIVYGSDWEFTAISIPPEQAQFVETQKLTANQIAAIYGIAPEDVGGEPANSLTYKTEESREIRTIADLRPWLVRLEWGFSHLMPPFQYVRFNADAVIRADLKSRHEVYAVDRSIGLLSINEIRALEDLPSIPNGDDHTPLPKLAQKETNPAQADSTGVSNE